MAFTSSASPYPQFLYREPLLPETQTGSDNPCCSCQIGIGILACRRIKVAENNDAEIVGTGSRYSDGHRKNKTRGEATPK
jgi:hypothetical protein